VRGYAEDQFRAATAAWINLEYRYLFGPRSRAFLFTDAAVYDGPGGAAGAGHRVKVGYGLGIRLETGLGIMGVDYGLCEGDGLSRGKVHVGLKNAF
jgi:outer membrane protein assembly factor BamA